MRRDSPPPRSVGPVNALRSSEEGWTCPGHAVGRPDGAPALAGERLPPILVFTGEARAVAAAERFAEPLEGEAPYAEVGRAGAPVDAGAETGTSP